VNYYSDEKAAELIRLKPKLGIPDPRNELGLENCDLCGNSLFRQGYGDFSPEPRVFVHPKLLNQNTGSGETSTCGCAAGSAEFPGASAAPATQAKPASNGSTASPDVEALVKSITDQVMSALGGSR